MSKEKVIDLVYSSVDFNRKQGCYVKEPQDKDFAEVFSALSLLGNSFEFKKYIANYVLYNLVLE